MDCQVYKGQGFLTVSHAYVQFFLTPSKDNGDMDIDTHYAIKGRKWYPRFEDPATERAFMREFNAEALKSGRVGVFFILIMWVGFAWFDMRLDEAMKSEALFFRLLMVTPVLLAFLVALYSRYAVGIYQILITACLFIIEGSIYYVVQFFDFSVISRSLGYTLPLEAADA